MAIVLHNNTFCPRNLRRGYINRSGDSGSEKKRAMRKVSNANKKWCKADYALTQRENVRYVEWCAKIDRNIRGNKS